MSWGATEGVRRVGWNGQGLLAWSMISWGFRLRANPPLPVAQNVQRIGQPTWELTQAVRRVREASAGRESRRMSRAERRG